MKTKKDEFMRGVAVAISTVYGLHGAQVECNDAMNELNLTIEVAKQLDLTEYDMQQLVEIKS